MKKKNYFDVLIKKISTDNCLDYLKLVEKMKAKNLEKKSVEFIDNNINY